MRRKTPGSLKRSWFVTLISVGLMLAPIGNYLFTSWTVGYLQTGTSEELLRGLSQMQWTDWLTAGMLFFSGALLWKRHRFAWVLAVILLAIVTVWNLRLAWVLYHLDKPAAYYIQLWTNLLTTLAGFGILLFLRYPYVERRHGLFAPAARHQVTLPCQVRFENHTVPGVLTSVSKSGGRVEFENSAHLPENLPLEGVLEFGATPSRTFKLISKEPGYLRIRWKQPLRDLPDWLKQQGVESKLLRPQ